MMNEIVTRIQNLPHGSIIFISGFGGAGKSTLATQIAEFIPCQIIEFDDFYRDVTEYHNWDCYDYERLILEIIQPYKAQITSHYHAYNWPNPTKPLVKTCAQSDYLIIEGVGLFIDEILLYSDLSIWVDCPIDIAVSQGKYRDKIEYGLDNETMWDTIWKERDLEFERTYQPIKKAHIIYKK